MQLKSGLQAVCLITALSAGVVSISASGQESRSPKVVVRITPSKPSFAPNEKVTATVELRNASKGQILISSALIVGYNLTLRVHNSRGEEMKSCGVVSQWRTVGKQLTVLREGTSVDAEVLLSCDETRQEGFLLGSEGKYLVSATYRLYVSATDTQHQNPELPIARGPYVSEPAEFRITAQ